MKTKLNVLIDAMNALSVSIQSDDGVANAAIAEAAQRLREQDDRIEALECALEDAINTYDSEKELTIVTAERQETWQVVLDDKL